MGFAIGWGRGAGDALIYFILQKERSKKGDDVNPGIFQLH
jgi:hypothetical protein